MQKYISGTVLTSGGYDCSMNGVTVTHQLFIPVPDGNFNEDELQERIDNGEKLCMLEVGTAGNAPHFKPKGSPRGMFGGNYVTGDSRFGNAHGRRPMHVHDRFEG